MVQLNKTQGFAQPQTGLNQNNPSQFPSQLNQAQFQEQASQNQPLNNPLTSPKGLFQIPEKFLQLIPLIPAGLEMLTGQKIPPVGVLADILSGIQQMQLSLSQILANQQQL
jgi:hypothetical protein